jgi:hypothetical protein
VSTGIAVVLLLVGGAIAIVAWQLGRTTERQALREGAASPLAPTAAAVSDEVPAAPAEAPQPPPPAESEALYEIPVASTEERAPAPPEPPPAAAWPPAEDRPADTPSRCLMLQAHPSNVSAFGSSGEVVQLVVRAQNGCGTNFGSASFRAVAIGPDGSEVASAVGRFPEGVRAGGSAETLIALRTKPALSLTYRAEVQ